MSKKPTTEKPASNNSLIDENLNISKLTIDSNQWITDSLRTHLDAKSDSLDFNITSKLSAARHRALAQEHPGQSNASTNASWFNWTTSLGSTAVLALAIFVGLQLYPTVPSQIVGLGEVVSANQMAQQVLMEDLNLLSASDDIDFYQSVEFLEWMEINSG